VSYPVFASGTLGYPEKLWIPRLFEPNAPLTESLGCNASVSTTDCICALKPRGSYKEFVGICTSMRTDSRELTFASHGDYLFHVDNSSLYGIDDCIMFDGRTVNDEIPLTNRVARFIVEIITVNETPTE